MFTSSAIFGSVILLIGGHTGMAKADPSQVRIEISGIIPPVCSNSGNSVNLALDRLDRGGETSLAFAVDCNAPFQYRVESSNGGFSVASAFAAANAFTTVVPYTVAVNIPLDGGAIRDRCQSAQIKADALSCVLSSSGDKVAIGKTGSLNISWASSAKALLSGSYQDRLTISFSIRP